MNILVDENGRRVTITKIEGRKVTLGFDHDNLLACFATSLEATAALKETESDNYTYRHSMAVSQATLRVIPLKA